jgi:hypothetical protein
MTLPSLERDSSFEMHDLLDSRDFTQRAFKSGAANREQLALQQIAQKFASAPEDMLQELVQIAVEYCSADSAGVSLEEADGNGGLRFRWIAVAGSFEKYLNGGTPRKYSPCGVCIDEWRPQYYKVNQPYYDFLGVVAEPILDGMLIPWQSDTQRGTIWAVSHKSESAFDMSDYTMLKRLADLISVAVRHQPNSGGHSNNEPEQTPRLLTRTTIEYQ